MSNLLTTVPKSRFKDWETAERVLRRCDGETDFGEEGSEWLWFIRTSHLPKKPLDESVCFMIYDGLVRGYFHIIEKASSRKWVDLGYLLEDKPSPYVVVLAHWTTLPKSRQVEATGFQGWRYTALRP
ncbi:MULTISPECIES: hypothetical protein [unclassified Spirosoma]|uniref:hypothetical protein n=1 Tax=unclassified Spirosoma TaxID=2621999 RepID=UPI0009645810|nr:MULTISPECIES: hypothetical protein [unclassified Spirosoma]MBN8821293.1 hypothetical protein [Spirosoma sp.]OJW78082.1 MAG: hypothetical protein BGO59_29120 [Spirosoma sp. 48-14]